MADREGRAKAAGDLPRAPAFVGWAIVAGGALGLTLGVSTAAWTELGGRCFGGGDRDAARGLAIELLSSVAGLTLLGGLAGLVGAQIALGAWAPGWRWSNLRGSSSAPSASLPWIVAAALAIALLPTALLEIAGGTAGRADPGRLLLLAPLVALLAGLATGAAPALFDRARGRRRWRDRVSPQPPPRRDEDELAPEIRAALRARAQQRPPLEGASHLLVRGHYAIALAVSAARAPRIIAHGGPELIPQARALSLAVITASLLVDRLAAVPSGGSAPPDTWPALRALLRGPDLGPSDQRSARRRASTARK